MINIGIIGDYDAGLESHPATGASIGHAADLLKIEAGFEWLPTTSLLTASGLERLERTDYR